MFVPEANRIPFSNKSRRPIPPSWLEASAPIKIVAGAEYTAPSGGYVIVIIGGAQRSPRLLTTTSFVWLVVEPMPSWPKLFAPQA